jgi:hypothetical protein
MARCPAGHESQASDYCDTCGLVIGGESAGAGASPLGGSGAFGGSGAGAVSGAGVGVGGGQGGGGSAGPGGGGGCPVCDAERNGRFCEECGYDFDLAEAMPQVTMNPGVQPAQPEQQATTTFPDLEGGAANTASASFAASASASTSTSASESASVASPAAPEAETSGGGAGGSQGFDLDAELARAEAEAAAAVGAASETAASVPQQAQPTEEAEAPGVTESAAYVAATQVSTAGAVPDFASPQAPDTTLAEELPPVTEASSSLGMFSVGGSQVSGEELSVTVNADRDYYKAQVERGDIIESEFPFPKYPAERSFSFTEGPVRIGRASSRRGLIPEIDLTGPPLDPAVSHLHAQLLRHPEGWVVVDLGSANGTRLNDAEEPLEAETEIPVRTGDRIHLGVWTTVTIQ